MQRVLSVDPGTSHLAACIFELENENLKLVWSELFSVGHSHASLANVCKILNGIAEKLGTRTALVEYQAPIGAGHTCRWNAFVEGGLACCLSCLGMEVQILQPSAIKRKLGLATGNYKNNKLLAFKHAQERGMNIRNHHEADCFILAEWWAFKVLQI